MADKTMEMDVTLSDGRTIVAGTFVVPQGPPGADGKDGSPGADGAPGAPGATGPAALTTSEVGQMAADPVDPIILSMSTNSFNRTPVVGDMLDAMIQNTANGTTWFGPAHVTAVSGATTTLQWYSVQKLTGATGAKGADGADGQKGDPGPQGVSITNVTLKEV